MKKILIFLLVALISSCSILWESEKVKKAKEELWIKTNTPSFDITNNSSNQTQEKNEEKKDDLSDDPRISIKHISWDKVLQFDKLNYFDFKKWYAKIKWKTLSYVSKIEVDFSNPDSPYPNDEFTLKRFKAGWKTFEYNANSKYKVLDFWLNKYTIKAFTKSWVSITEIKVLVSENDDKYLDWTKNDLNSQKEPETTTSKLIWDENNVVFADLPEWWDFWNVIKLWEKSFTYSDIKWLEIKKQQFEKIDCSKDEENNTYYVTEFLKKRLNNWYYWNTCRDIIKWDWISFYVLRLDGDNNYIYEKHYLDFRHWFYWVYELDKWTWIDKYNISEKNKEFKEKNNNFTQVWVVDNLFKKIIKWE